jgi:chromate transporter
LVQGFVKGVYAAAIGAVFGAAVLLGSRVIGDWVTAVIAVTGLLALVRFSISGPVLVGLAGAVGLLTFQFTHPDWVLR